MLCHSDEGRISLNSNKYYYDADKHGFSRRAVIASLPAGKGREERRGNLTATVVSPLSESR